jgi:hypothetical protein
MQRIDSATVPRAATTASDGFFFGAFALATFLVHALTARGYGYQRDELYFIACAHHLQWGYVDQPPLIAAIARFTLAVLGTSPFALRLVPMLAAAGLVVMTGVFVRSLGAGRRAQAIAMLAVFAAPIELAVGNLLTMNAFEPLFWLGAATLAVQALRGEATRRTWFAFGALVGLGFLNKDSTAFFVVGLFAGIVLTRERTLLARSGPWIAAAVALLIVAPYLAWQAANGWPQAELLRNAAAHKLVVYGPFAFFAQQLLMMNPLAAPLWLAGVVWCFRARGAAAHLRAFGWAYVVMLALAIAVEAKAYYFAACYPFYIAAGAVAIERLLEARTIPYRAYVGALCLSGLVIMPLATPTLTLDAFAQYQHLFDSRSLKMERHPSGRVPQNFADQLGWNSLVQALALAYEHVPRDERTHAAIMTENYGQAGAVDFLGPAYGLPHAISGHNSYYLWGPGEARTLVTVGVSPDVLRRGFADVQRIGRYNDPFVLPDQSNLAIYLARKPRMPVTAWWPRTKHYL